MLEEETWVSLPDEAIPDRLKKKFRSMHRPVVKLVLALEGHPRAGKYWEEHAKSKILSCGWIPN